MTGKQLLGQLAVVGTVDHAFRFPYAYIRCVSAAFEGKDDDEREAVAAETMARSIAEIRKAAADCMFTLEWLTPMEASNRPIENRGEHWLRAFLDEPATGIDPVATHAGLRVAHFFGYKGGQGRSTVLACLAQKLAHEGAKVLVLDADIEAPSLDVLFGVKSNGVGSTLLGIVQNASPILAIPALQGRDGGEVRLIGCRPRDVGYDIDFAAFAMQTSLVPGVLTDALTRIGLWALDQRFDAVLIDHRSGMAMTTLTWMRALPGPVAVFSKLDDQWRGAESVLREILAANPTNPGIIVTFKPDEETDDGFRRRTVRQRSDLLDLLGAAIAVAADGDKNDESMDIEDHWVLWPYDQAFRTTTLPDTASLGGATKDALGEVTRLFEISAPTKKRLSSIGSLDQGDLIQTEALRKLTQSGNSLRYILGRKGTGKTRLATELAIRQLGQALLVDASSAPANGITTADIEFGQARDRFRSDPEGLWWTLLLAALEGPDTLRADLRSRLTAILDLNPSVQDLRGMVIDALKRTEPRVFLMDGIETAFGVSEVYAFVEKLFLFMLTLQSDDRFVGRVEVKLFLRTDLASRSVQNLEQQISGRSIQLFWDYQRILNFMLSRLPMLSFFQRTFPNMIAEIMGVMQSVRAGDVTSDDGERILLQSLPQRLPRFNILTSTFLRLHFADSSVQGDSYYPRVIDSFLNELNSIGEQNEAKALIDGRLDQQLLIRAHEKACSDYMEQIRQELQHLLDFNLDNPAANRTKLDEWLNSFDGKKTPFGVEFMEEQLAARTKLDRAVVRRCLDQMLALGIFERSVDSPSTWRTGRLFKSSLKMKYKRD
jgi:Mrp family chromosome partitioning ATPase